MALSYPLAWPSVKAPARVSLSREAVVGYSESPFTLQGQAQVHAGMRWLGQAVLPPMVRADMEAWLGAFLMALNGMEGTFLAGPADWYPDYALLGAGPGSPAPQVMGGSQTGRTLITDGWPLSTLVLKAGDFFGLGSGSTSRLYQVVKDATTNVSGEVTLDIWPRLRESPANNDPLELSTPRGVFRLAGNVADWSVDPNRLYQAGFSFMEAI